MQNITHVKLRQDGWNVTHDNGQVTFVPTGHRFSHVVQDWINAGNTPEPEVTLQESKDDKIAELQTACEQAITSGFTSSALGSKHIYPSTQLDQHNMDACIISSLIPNLPSGWTTEFTCIPVANKNNIEWPLKAHTVAQIQQAGLDGKKWILAQRKQFKAFKAQVKNLATNQDVQAVTWTDGSVT